MPLGYTKHSRRFHSSYSDDPAAARAVVRALEPYQERARRALGITRFQLSDEFYVASRLPVPPAETYDGYPQFYDGIGMLRSFLDETALVARDRAHDLRRIDDALAEKDLGALLVCGERRRARRSTPSAARSRRRAARAPLPFATTTLAATST